MRKPGTLVSNQFDVRRLGAAIAMPGIDTRLYLAEGIVAAPGNDGEIDDQDPNLSIVAAEGREVDVILLPLMAPLACRVLSGGPNSTDDWPIKPGDHVLVGVPEGESANGGVIIGVLNSAADQLPVENGQPMFDNASRLIWANIPIHIRSGSGNGRVTMTPAGEVELGGPGAAQQVILGTDFVAALKDLLTHPIFGISKGIEDMLGACTAAPLDALAPGLIIIKGALEAWGKRASIAADWLSTVSKTK